MSVDAIIEAGNNIIKPEFSFFDIHWESPAIWIMLIVLSCLIVSFFFVGDVTTVIFGIFLCICLFLLGNSLVDMGSSDKTKQYNDSIDKWKNEMVLPYIESLPKEKSEIVYIKIDPEMGNTVNYGHYYTYVKTKKLTPLTISYVDEDTLVTETNWYETNMKLTDESKPYVEFQRLEKDLGHGIDKGIYNAVVYLPKSYTFTEIK